MIEIDKKYMMIIGAVVVVVIILISMFYSYSAADNKTVKKDNENFLQKEKFPLIGTVPSVLTTEETHQLIAIGDKNVKQSTFGKNIEQRNSSHCYLDITHNPSLLKITNVLETLTNEPRSNFEPFELVRFNTEQYHKYHTANLHPEAPDYKEYLETTSEKGVRKYTGIVFLNNDYVGGEIHLPEIGTVIKKPPGTVSVFQNVKLNSRETNTDAIFADTPVLTGTKWVLNVYIRDKKYVGKSATELNNIHAATITELSKKAQAQNQDILPSKKPVK